MTAIIQAPGQVFATFPWRDVPGTMSWGPLVVGSFKSSLVLTSPTKEQYQRIYKWCVSKMGREFDKHGGENPRWNVSLTVQTSSTLVYDSKGKNAYLNSSNIGSFHYGTVRFNIDSYMAVELKLMEDYQ